MAQFRATIQGNRGEVSRLGTKASGMLATINGWNVGVFVEAGTTREGEDTITVCVTGGSNGDKPSYVAFTIGEKCGLLVGKTLREKVREELDIQHRTAPRCGARPSPFEGLEGRQRPEVADAEGNRQDQQETLL